MYRYIYIYIYIFIFIYKYIYKIYLYIIYIYYCFIYTQGKHTIGYECKSEGGVAACYLPQTQSADLSMDQESYNSQEYIVIVAQRYAKSARIVQYGGFHTCEYAKVDCFVRENPSKMDDLRVPPFVETRISIHILQSHPQQWATVLIFSPTPGCWPSRVSTPSSTVGWAKRLHQHESPVFLRHWAIFSLKPCACMDGVFSCRDSDRDNES